MFNFSQNSFLVIACLYLGMALASASDGYAESDILAHFGKPASERDFGFGKELSFKKDEFEVLVDLYNGQACQLIFATEQDQEISEKRRLSILQKYFPQLAWNEKPPPIGNRNPVVEWTSASPWRASYSDGVLGIQNSDLYSLYDQKLRAYYASHDTEIDKRIRDWLNRRPMP